MSLESETVSIMHLLSQPFQVEITMDGAGTDTALETADVSGIK